MAFDGSAAVETKKALADAKKADQQTQLYSMAKTAGTVGAVVVLLVAAMLSSRRRNKRLRKLLKAEVAQLDGETPKIGGSAAKELDGAGGAGDRLALAPAAPADPALAERAERQREIAALVEKQPEEVAQLLRGWLADRRG
jgi:flagellar M-ring protein FliF